MCVIRCNLQIHNRVHEHYMKRLLLIIRLEQLIFSRSLKSLITIFPAGTIFVKRSKIPQWISLKRSQVNPAVKSRWKPDSLMHFIHQTNCSHYDTKCNLVSVPFAYKIFTSQWLCYCPFDFAISLEFVIGSVNLKTCHFGQRKIVWDRNYMICITKWLCCI